MIEALFDPNLLFADPIRWKDEVYKDDFIANLLDHLEALENIPESRLLWSDDLEADLWTSPTVPPWRADRDLAVPLIPIVIKHLARLRHLIYDHRHLPVAHLTPCLVTPPAKPDSMLETRRLISYCVLAGSSWNIVLAPSNVHAAQNLEIEVGRTTTNLVPVVSTCCWAGLPEVRRTCWPAHGRDDGRRFRAFIGWLTDHLFCDVAGATRHTQYEFSKEFLESLRSHLQSSEIISNAICKRLALGQMHSVNDSGLRDEAVRTSSERRFRVSGSCRIHYHYVKGSLVFSRYYSEGEHDDGLP
jgi:hypothetical protein